MALAKLMLLLLFMLFLFMQASTAWRFNATLLDESHKVLPSRGASDPAAPLTFFEVRRPIPLDSGSLCSSVNVLHYSFGNTANSPPVVVSYNPPTDCAWKQVILRWRVTSIGRQFDRISAVWLDGVEIFRTSTAEPVRQGIVWQVEKDVTKYSALLSKPSRDLAVSLGNVIDKTYTGFFNVTLSFDFYANHSSSSPQSADVILPIAMPNSTNGGYWFQIQNNADVRTVQLANLPRNIYKAELELYVSFHGNDEFWYTNPTDDYLEANNLTGSVAGNGPYREVLAMFDEKVVGEICPFPVIFTGGINPLMWRPAAAIGAFDLPSYTLDLTPLVGRMVDGENHQVSLSVTNALAFWLVDANLHLWLDHGSSRTSGKLTGYSSPPADISYQSHYTGPDGTLRVSASRWLKYSGFVVSSHGNLTTTSSYSYRFSNQMDFSEGGNVSVVNQQTDSQAKFVVGSISESVSLRELSSSYPLYLYSDQQQGSNKTLVLGTKLDHALVQEVTESTGSATTFNRLTNRQKTHGKIWIQGNLVTNGTGALEQAYTYESSDGCYYRTVKTSNTTTLYDHSSTECMSSL